MTVSTAAKSRERTTFPGGSGIGEADRAGRQTDNSRTRKISDGAGSAKRHPHREESVVGTYFSLAPGQSLRAGVALVVLLLGFFALHMSLPLADAVVIGSDEGFELAKAMLGLHGQSLYAEAWNDQPPLHTFLVVQVLKHLSPGVLGARLVTVVAAAVLLAGVFSLTYRVCGLGVADLTVVLLMVSPGFLELSASCMLEIPALAPAVLALAMLRCGRGEWGDGRSKMEDGGSAVDSIWTRWHVREIVAGFLFGLALLMKLVPAVLLPLAALIVWLRTREGGQVLAGSVEQGNGKRRSASQWGSQRRLTSAATGRRLERRSARWLYSQ